jgi:EmrB/QacA subfamily drug resistance transporter
MSTSASIGADIAASSPPISSRELRIVFCGLILAMVLAALDQSIVNTALPRMASDLGGMAHISWVVTVFLLTSTITAPLYGKLSDMYGRRRLFVISISLFLAASTLCGVSQTMTQLILFRALQGAGAGGLMTLSQTVIGDLVTPRERGRYQGLFTGAFAVSSVAGPLIGGGLTTALSWRWVFYVNLPLGGLALALILIGLKQAAKPVSHRVDYLGAVLLAGAAACTLLLFSWGGSLIPWASPQALELGVLAVIFIAAFLWQERRASEPIINLQLFRIPAFSVGVAATGCMTFAMTGAMVFLPLYFQLVLGLSPAKTGLMLLPQILSMLISSVVGGQLSSRLGQVKPFLVAGVGLEVAGLSTLAIAAFLGAGIPVFLLALAMVGLGMGIGMPNATVVVQNAVPRETLGVATASMSFMRSLGSAMGVAVSGGVMSSHLTGNLARIGRAIDAHALLEGGMGQINALSPLLHAQVDAAYRQAIGFSFSIGGGVMSVALMLVLSLRGVTPRGPAPKRAAEDRSRPALSPSNPS